MRRGDSIPHEIAKSIARGGFARAIAHTPVGAWFVAGSGLFMLLGVGFSFMPQHRENLVRYLLIGLFLVALSLLLMMREKPRSQRLLLILAPVTLALGALWGYGELCQDYAIALDYMQQGQYEDARQLFQSLQNFRDSREMRADCERYQVYEDALANLESSPARAYQLMRPLAGFAPADEQLGTPAFQAAREKALAVGKTVDFGRYHWEHAPRTPEAGLRAISWKILARDGDRALLISSSVLDRRALHQTKHPVTWADCTLRQWLNGEFLHFTFTEAEQAAIELTDIPSADGEAAPAQDRLFLLSYDEVCRYMPQAYQRIAEDTPYLSGRSGQQSAWLLRPTGPAASSAPCIDLYGSLTGADAAFEPEGVRPAMWVVLNPAFF